MTVTPMHSPTLGVDSFENLVHELSEATASMQALHQQAVEALALTVQPMVREHTLDQLVVPTNLESLNAVFIRQGLPAPERLHKLNDIAITQMRSLLTDHNIKRLAS